jgi:hypothetical protein
MDDNKRIQINVHLGQGQMEQLQTLAAHYGGISAAVRVALDALWREYVRGHQELASIEDDVIHEDSDAGRSPA